MGVDSEVSPARTCADCGRETPGDGPFCVHCGAGSDDAASPPPGAGRPEGPADVAELASQVRRLTDQVLALSRRLAELEAVVGPSTAPAAPEIVEAAPQPAVPAEPPGLQTLETPPAAAAPASLASAEPPGDPGMPAFLRATPAAGDQAPPPPRFVERPPFDWERVLGRNWFAIIGVVALAIGVGFFLKLAFDNQWIGPTGRVVLGVVVGLVMVGLAEYTARRAPPWAQAVAGGGIAILYLALYASFGFYDLIPLVPALVLLGLTVALGWFLAIRYDSRVVASLALFGAFLTPALLGEDLSDRLSVGLAYLLIIDAGIVAVASLRRWRWYTLAGMVASYLLFAGLIVDNPPDQPIAAQLGLSGVFLIFLAAATLHNIVWRRKPNQFDMTLIMVNGFAFFGLTFAVMWDQYEPWFGLITLLLAAVHGLVALAARARTGVSPVVPLQLGGAALVFLTVAAPLQFTGEWIAVAWAAEGAVLVGLGTVTASWQGRVAGLLVLACAVLRILIIETPSVEVAEFVPVLNGRFLAFAFGIGALYTAAWLYRRVKGSLHPFEAHVSRVLVAVASLLTLWIFSAEAISYFDRQTLEAAGNDASERFRNSLLTTLTITWAVYGSLLMAVARWRGSRLLAIGGVTVVWAAAAKLLLIDTFLIEIPRGTHWVVLNYYFLSFAVVMAGIVLAAALEHRSKAFSAVGGIPVVVALVIVANGIAAWVFTAEVVRFFNHRELMQGGDYDAAMHLTLTLMWAVHAALVIAAGILRRSRALRVTGIVMLAVPVAKLFVFDVFLLERGYRVGAFATLGVMLLAMGLAYQRYGTAVKGLFRGDGDPIDAAESRGAE